MDYKRDKEAYITRRSLELSQDGHSESVIAKLLSDEFGESITRNVVHGRIYRNKPPKIDPPPELHYFNKYKKFYNLDMQPPDKVHYDKFETVKILNLNDIHVPFHDEDAIMAAVEIDRSSDIVVLSEVMDLYSKSSFAKFRNVPLELEIEHTIRLYEYFSNLFPIVYVLKSTHDARVIRNITTRIGTDLLFLTETNIPKFLARPFKNILYVDLPYIVINDALFSHFNSFSNTRPLAGVDKVRNWLYNWGRKLGIPEVRLIMHGHTHHSGIYNYVDMQIVETGCLENITDFVINNIPLQPWVVGWGVAKQVNGKTDLNETRVRVYDNRGTSKNYQCGGSNPEEI